MLTNRSLRLLCTVTTILLLGAGLSSCRLNSWSRYSRVPYQSWRAQDSARIALLQEVARGSSDKAARLSRGPGLYHLTMSRRWASKARIAWEAVRLLQASPANPTPQCAKALARLRWQIDYRYPCAVGWVTNLFVHTYLKVSPTRQARLRQRIRRMGYHCGPHRDFEHYFLRRLRRAQHCATGAAPTATPSAVPGGAPSGGTPPASNPPASGDTVTPPPAPGHTPTPSPAPPRKKR